MHLQLASICVSFVCILQDADGDVISYSLATQRVVVTGVAHHLLIQILVDQEIFFKEEALTPQLFNVT